ADIPAPRAVIDAVDLLQLAARQLARVLLDLLNGRLEKPGLGPLARAPPLGAQVLVQLRHADRSANPTRVIGGRRVEDLPDLVDQAGGDHPVHALRHEGAEDRQRDVDPDEEALVAEAESGVVVDEGLDVGVGAAGDDR
ncbi:hypothetical protein PanWU01x14_006280, partial [Parasponia andersonii]